MAGVQTTSIVLSRMETCLIGLVVSFYNLLGIRLGNRRKSSFLRLRLVLLALR
jgi:hypothetical protein